MNNNLKIVLNKPFWGKEEKEAVLYALQNGTGVGDLEFSEALSKKLQESLSVKYVLPTGSGTAALEMACLCLLEKGDEVILPSFTFASSANAVLLAGATPVFVDIEPDTYNIDPHKIIKSITKKTKAIMVVHYAGMACNMYEIIKIAKEYKLFIIEDAAHSIGAKYKNKHLGTLGDVGCLSFHGTKNIASGEGGALITNNFRVFKKAEIIREKGTNRSSFMRGERQMYTWVSVGSSLILSDILSAIALEQIKKLDLITHLRNRVANYYFKKLDKLRDKLILPQVSPFTSPNWHIYSVRVSKSRRDKLIQSLKKHGIQAAFHYLPLHTSVMGKKLGYKKGQLPVTEEVASTLVRLPIYPALKRSEMDYIAEVFGKVL